MVRKTLVLACIVSLAGAAGLDQATLPSSLVLDRSSVQPGPGPEPGWAEGEETLHFDGDPDRGFNIRGTYCYGCAARFTAEESLRVKAVLYYLTGNADAIFVHVSDESTESQPSMVMLDTTRATGLGGGVWRRANMPRQPAVRKDRDFWTCVIVRRHPAEQYPLTLDLGPITPFRGGFITLPEIGPTWYQLTDPPFWTDRNVNIRAVVEDALTGVEHVLGPTDPAVELRLRPSVMRNRGTEVGYRVRRQSRVELRVFDAAGTLVRTLVNELAVPGGRTALWDCRADNGERVRAGTYLCRLTVGDRTALARAVVLD